MNACRFVLPLLLLVSLTATPLRGIAQPLQPNVRTTASAAAVRNDIQKFLAEQLGQYTSSDPAAQKAAREMVVTQVQTGGVNGATPPSAEFLRAYAEALAAAVEPLLKHDDPRVRLNAAVTVAKVAAEKSNSIALAPRVVTMLNDDSEGVVLWGLKASKFLVPGVLSSGPSAKSNPLIPAIVAAAKKYDKTGALAQMAYDALRIDQATDVMTPANFTSGVPMAVDAVQDLFVHRLDLYNQGIPDVVMAEIQPVTFLTIGSYKKQSQDRQIKTVQLLSDLISVAAQRIAVQGISNNEKQDLARILITAGQGLGVVGDQINQQTPMNAAVQPLANATPTLGVAELVRRAEAVYPGLIKIPVYSKLKPPPKLQ